MRSREMEKLLEQASKLTPAQKQQLLWVLRQSDEAARVVEVLESRPASCPHCNCSRMVRHGHASGLRRYRCRDCGKTLNALTGTPLARLRHKGKWGQQARVLREGQSVYQSAATLAVAPSTAFRWRHRFLQLAQGVKARVLQGVVEADETCFLRSFKGQRVQGRKARHRGGSAAKRGLFDEQEPLLVVIMAAPRTGCGDSGAEKVAGHTPEFIHQAGGQSPGTRQLMSKEPNFVATPKSTATQG